MFSFYRIQAVKLPLNIISYKFHTSTVSLAGHSKWANIKHIKALKDGQKSVTFAKYSRQIRLAIQEGGSPNPALNTTLQSVIEEALKKQMPNATIQSTLKKYTTPSAELKKQILEMKIQGKIYVVAILYSDNIAGVKMNISTLLRKAKGAYAEAKHLFTESGFIEAISPETNGNLEEICTEHAITVGAEDVEIVDNAARLVTFICNPRDIEKIKKELKNLNYNIESSEHVYMPNNPIILTDAEIENFKVFRDKLKVIEGIEDIFDNIDEPIS